MMMPRIIAAVIVGAVLFVVAIAANAEGLQSDGVDAPESSDSTEAISRLLREKSPDTLAQLLEINGLAPVHIAKIGASLNVISDHEQYVLDVDEIVSGERTLVVAVATIERAQQNRELVRNYPRVACEAVYIFDDCGKHLRTVGGRVDGSKIGGDRLRVSTHGTSDTWFVWTMYSAGNRWSYPYVSEIYPIQGDVPLAMRFYHFHTDPIYTLRPSDTERHGVYFGFRGLNNILDRDDLITGANGNEYPPRIVWDAKSRKFRGPSAASNENRPIFRVDTEASESFNAVDLD